ncbi:hypothetical protein BCR33DRAFT_363955 [Rhizoclosmatium globosum]|uniref:Uncharacterized protein n=1 Tax=Rhizoclosmatium globosum TaxID=329046 RepID=A0A1Y2C044_9FUNG|nr:hypothetical protein BCR33DRAFT_363955 [Rhizoclosmatium globosum]|eukprot:ORY40398.1 hypothetical protein BCR33DRAFT_363955 [Rhizoclosmatium globosum]
MATLRRKTFTPQAALSTKGSTEISAVTPLTCRMLIQSYKGRLGPSSSSSNLHRYREQQPTYLPLLRKLHSHRQICGRTPITMLLILMMKRNLSKAITN